MPRPEPTIPRGLRSGLARRPAGRRKVRRISRPASAHRACLVLFLASTLGGRAGATTLFAADVLSRHDVAALTRAENGALPIDQTTRALGPVGAPTFSQRSSSGIGRQGSSATVTSFAFNNIPGSELAVQQSAGSR